MAGTAFLYDNLFGNATLSHSSQHSNFPAANLKKRWFTKSWRSNYGTSSGWGNFNIEAGVNDDIDFEETAASELTATLTAGTYTADELATEIKTQLDVAGASTYTVTYSDSTNKFTLASDRAGGGNTFKLLWNTGTNSVTTVGGTIGFDTSADDADAASHTADNLRIHSEEWIVIDLGSAADIDAFALKYYNLTNTATIKLQGNDSDAWGAPPVDITLTKTSGVIAEIFSSTETYRYWRILITDVDNADGYVEMGRAFLGEYFNPARSYQDNYTKTLYDPSDVLMSDGGQITTNQKTYYKTFQFNFRAQTTADTTTFMAIWDEVGLSKDFFFLRDKADTSTAFYVRFNQPMSIDHIIGEDYYSVSIILEELR